MLESSPHGSFPVEDMLLTNNNKHTTTNTEQPTHNQHTHKQTNKPNQTKPNQTKPNQTKPNQTKPNQTKPNQTKPNQTSEPINQSHITRQPDNTTNTTTRNTRRRRMKIYIRNAASCSHGRTRYRRLSTFECGERGEACGHEFVSHLQIRNHVVSKKNQFETDLPVPKGVSGWDPLWSFLHHSSAVDIHAPESTFVNKHNSHNNFVCSYFGPTFLALSRASVVGVLCCPTFTAGQAIGTRNSRWLRLPICYH